MEDPQVYPRGTRPANRILASLPSDDFLRLAPTLRPVLLTPNLVLHRQNEEIREVIFPAGGVVSVTRMMRDGSSVEVAPVGAEGLVGLNVVLGGTSASGESTVQVPGPTASAMPVEVFERELERGGPFEDHVRRYGQGVTGLMMQSAGCLARHPVRARCCRWLLMAHDRVGADQFELSQDVLATMLGVTRSAAGGAANALRSDDLIKYSYGRVTVVDRTGLEAGACECYRTVADLFAQLHL